MANEMKYECLQVPTVEIKRQKIKATKNVLAVALCPTRANETLYPAFRPADLQILTEIAGSE